MSSEEKMTPEEVEHPIQSTATLVKVTLIAALIAAILLVTAILPAEYNIDPTGLGEKMGLTELAPKKKTLVSRKPPQKSSKDGFMSDRVEVIIPAGKGQEYKFHLLKGSRMLYSWDSMGIPLYFDFHGEPDGDTTGYFESYTESTASEVKGSFKAPFDGSHGWYWENKTDAPVSVILSTQGQYEIIGLK
jgi:hypothetical protein